LDKKPLQQVTNYKYIGCEISYEIEKVIQHKLAKFPQILWILYKFWNKFGPEIFKNKLYNALVVPILLHGSEIWDFRLKGEKRLTSSEMKTFGRIAGWELFDYKKQRRNFGRVESRISWRETKKTQIKSDAMCDNNGQQQDAKFNAELCTTW